MSIKITQSSEEIYRNLAPEIQALVKDYSSLTPITIHWGEQDAYNHLNNVVFARYAETARLSFFEQFMRPKLPHEDYLAFIQGTGIGPILKTLQIDYKLPVFYPDVVLMASRIPLENIGQDRFKHDFIAVSVAQKKVAAVGFAIVVTFDYQNQRKADIPLSFKKILIDSGEIKCAKL